MPKRIAVGVNGSFPIAQDVFFVALDFLQPHRPDWRALLQTVIIPNRAEWQCFGFLHQGQPRSVIALAFQLLVLGVRLEHGAAQGAQHVARADDPRCDTVDAGVKVIQTDVRAPEVIARAPVPARWPANRR